MTTAAVRGRISLTNESHLNALITCDSAAECMRFAYFSADNAGCICRAPILARCWVVRRFCWSKGNFIDHLSSCNCWAYQGHRASTITHFAWRRRFTCSRMLHATLGTKVFLARFSVSVMSLLWPARSKASYYCPPCARKTSGTQGSYIFPLEIWYY